MSDMPQINTNPTNGGSVTYNLSVRDYFAAKAMQAITSGDYQSFAHMAEDAYAIADAMLAAREAKS